MRISEGLLFTFVIALVNQIILVTRNQKDFSKVPDLFFEDWTND
jgi:predicted nucleic acid-binding protein